MLPLNCDFSGLGWCILDFSKPVGQGGFGAHSEAKLVSQFMQTKFLWHKMSQNSTVLTVSSSSECTCFERKICFIFFFTYSFQAVSEMFLTIFQLFVKMIFISKRCKHKHLSYSFHLQNSQHQFVCTNFMTNWLLCLINPIQKNYFQVRISVCVFILALRSGWTWFYIYVLFPI